MNIQIHLQIGSLAQLNRASDYGSEGYRFESYASHLRILISSSVFGSNEIRIFSISTGRIIIIHIFAVNTKNILFKIKGKHLKAHYKTSIAISLIVIIVLVILRTTVTGQDSIKFIDDTDDQPIDQQNSDSIDLRYSNEYQSWKQTSDTTFRSLFNGNQQADILAEHPGNDGIMGRIRFLQRLSKSQRAYVFHRRSIQKPADRRSHDPDEWSPACRMLGM